MPIAASRACTLQQCLETFTEEEELDVEYTCEHCKAETRKVKRMRLYTPPATLVIHLKRFSASSGGGAFGGFALMRGPSFSRMRKNAAAVAVPQSLNIAPFCNPAGLRASDRSSVYELLAISEHSGSLGGGHYTAVGRAVSDGHWYSFNDQCVSRLKQCPEGPSSEAYVLFYRRQDRADCGY